MNPASNWKSFAPLRRRIVVVLLLLVITVLGYVVFTICNANFHTIVSGEAYRSSQMNGSELEHVIQEYGIKSVLNLRGKNLTAQWYQDEITTSARLNVAHFDLSLGSGTSLSLEQMDGLVTVLRLAPKPVLIHCFGGADRSGLASALYCYAIDRESPAVADRELSIWYGHLPLIRPKVIAMDNSFWLYVSNHVAYTKPSL